MKKTVLLTLLLLLFLPLGSCASKGPGITTPETQTQTGSELALLDSASEIQDFVSEYRGLEFLENVPKRIQSKEQTEQFLIERIEEEFSREEITGAERLLKRLGLLPEDYDYYNSMIKLMTEQLAGMYDYKEQFLAIAEWLPVEMQEPILAHELTHALQDQHYGLENYLSPDTDNDDRALALSSLVEGDATLVGFAYTMQPLGQDVTSIPDYVQFLGQQSALMEATLPLFASSPEYVKQTLMFSYTYGTEFVKDLILEYGWEGIETAYINPPVTSEQILHSEKYLDEPDLPQDAEAEAEQFFGKSSKNGEVVCSNVLGEFTTYLMLSEFLEAEDAWKGAEGWDGDLVTLLETKGKTSEDVLQMTFCWDNRKEAVEFRRIYEQYLIKRYQRPDSETIGDQEQLSIILKQQGIRITLEGSTVFISDRFAIE